MISAAFAKRLAEVEREVAKIAPPATPEWLRWAHSDAGSVTPADFGLPSAATFAPRGEGGN